MVSILILFVGNSTDAITGEHLILTAGGIDSHVHYISPQQGYAALSNGVTTFFGGGVGPTDGTNGTTITPGPWNISKMLEAIDAMPVNRASSARGTPTTAFRWSNRSRPARAASRC